MGLRLEPQKEQYHAKMKNQDAKGVSVWGETEMDTLEKLLKARSPTMIPSAASHLLLTHPNQPTHRSGQEIKLQSIKNSGHG